MVMRVRNCPKCYGMGFRGHAGRCRYCNGKKKVTSEFVKWDLAREKAKQESAAYWEEQMQIQAEIKIDDNSRSWMKKNPKPRKFPKA